MSNVFILLLLRGIQYSANNLWQKYNTKYQKTSFSHAGQCIALQMGILEQRSESGVKVLNEH